MRSIEETRVAIDTAEHVLAVLRDLAATDSRPALRRLAEEVEHDCELGRASLVDALALSRG